MNRVAANVLRNFHSWNIERFGQGLSIGHVSGESFAVIRRAPSAGSGNIEGDWLITNAIEGRMAKLKRGGIDEGLEGRSGLSSRLSGTVERPGRARVTPADHGPNGALFVHHHNRDFCFGTLRDFVIEHPADGLLCRGLNGLIQRGLDQYIFRGVAGEIPWTCRHDPICKISPRAGSGCRAEGRGIGDGQAGLGGREVIFPQHQPKDHVRTRLCSLEIMGRR